jgi:hypothetical protein
MENKFKVGDLKAGNERSSKSSNWRGGVRLNKRGYRLVYCPEHPNCQKSGFILEHRLVMERHIGRFLKREERVHHINKIKTDNRIINLQLFANESEHQSSISHHFGQFVWKGRESKRKMELYFKKRPQYLLGMKLRYYRLKMEKMKNDGSIRKVM